MIPVRLEWSGVRPTILSERRLCMDAEHCLCMVTLLLLYHYSGHIRALTARVIDAASDAARRRRR